MTAPKFRLLRSIRVVGVGSLAAVAAIVSLSVCPRAHAEEKGKKITVPHIAEIPGPDWSRPEVEQPKAPAVGESMAGMKTAPDSPAAAQGLPSQIQGSLPPAAQPAPMAAPPGQPSSAAPREGAVAKAAAPAAVAAPAARPAAPAAPAAAPAAPAPAAEPQSAAQPPSQLPQGAKQTTIGAAGGIEPPYELRITATARQVWVWVSVDGGPVQATSLDQGENATFEAKERYVLTVDDAGGVEATLNGKSLPSLGAPSQAKRKLVIPSPELSPVG